MSDSAKHADPAAGPKDSRKAERRAVMPLGIVVERRVSRHRWQKHVWKPVAVLPGAGPASWKVLDETPECTRYHAVTLELELHRKETEGYRYNLSGHPPALYVGMRPTEDPAFPWRPFIVTASAWDSQAISEFGDDMVEAVPLPPAVGAWIADFVARHHVDEPFFKRRRKGRDKRLGETSDFERVDAERLK